MVENSDVLDKVIFWFLRVGVFVLYGLALFCLFLVAPAVAAVTCTAVSFAVSGGVFYFYRNNKKIGRAEVLSTAVLFGALTAAVGVLFLGFATIV